MGSAEIVYSHAHEINVQRRAWNKFITGIQHRTTFQDEMVSVTASGQAIKKAFMKVSHEHLLILLVVMTRKCKQSDLA